MIKINLSKAWSSSWLCSVFFVARVLQHNQGKLFFWGYHDFVLYGSYSDKGNVLLNKQVLSRIHEQSEANEAQEGIVKLPQGEWL